VKAGAVGVWHVDLMELENKVLGEESKGKLEVKMGVGEWKSFVEKKRELGERLMWQYGKDYEQGRGQKGDIKMLLATQRSGTNADKVSAFSVLIGDNPVGNLRSLDALLGILLDFNAVFMFLFLFFFNVFLSCFLLAFVIGFQ
jgi:ribosome biogenesis protein MAK21